MMPIPFRAQQSLIDEIKAGNPQGNRLMSPLHLCR